MTTLTQHAEAFSIMSKHGKPREGMGIYGDHYFLYANADPSDFSDANKEKLEKLGWTEGSDDVGEPAFFHVR